MKLFSTHEYYTQKVYRPWGFHNYQLFQSALKAHSKDLLLVCRSYCLRNVLAFITSLKTHFKTISSENELHPQALAIEITSSRKKNKDLGCALLEFGHFSTQFQHCGGCPLSHWRYVNKILKHKVGTSGHRKCSWRPKGKCDEMRE